MAIVLRRGQPAPYPLDERRRHREVNSPLRRPVHPGVTRRESGYTASELERLAAGVCEDLADATERGERIANRVLIGCGLIVIGYVIAKAAGWW